MITTIVDPVLPDVARLGFDDGWLLLPPTFLNLRMPVLVVDHAYIGNPTYFGLGPFGSCDPATPLPWTSLLISSYGDVIILHSRSTPVIATACLQGSMRMLAAHPYAILVVGSTYELQSTWAALWKMSIGRAKIASCEGAR
jgi:hypothetical protein